MNYRVEGIICGQIAGGLLAARLGKTKIQCMVVFAVGAVFLACKFRPMPLQSCPDTSY